MSSGLDDVMLPDSFEIVPSSTGEVFPSDTGVVVPPGSVEMVMSESL